MFTFSCSVQHNLRIGPGEAKGALLLSGYPT